MNCHLCNKKIKINISKLCKNCYHNETISSNSWYVKQHYSEENLNKLCNSGIIDRVGGCKNRYYKEQIARHRNLI